MDNNEIVLNLEMWKAFIALLENPPEPNQKLLETMRKHNHWVEEEDWMESFDNTLSLLESSENNPFQLSQKTLELSKEVANEINENSARNKRRGIRDALIANLAGYRMGDNPILDILNILKQGVECRIQNAYDNAINALSEYDNILVSVLQNSFFIQSINSNQTTAEEKWEIFIKGIACATKISYQDRFDAIIKLYGMLNSYLVKTAAIDALLMLDDGININSIGDCLARYSTNWESNEIVRKYAEEALADWMETFDDEYRLVLLKA